MTNYKLEDFADDNFKLDENGEKVSKRVENTLGKGEIARYKQFLLFPQCFQKTCTVATKKPGLVGKWLNVAKMMISLFDRAENTVEKGENVGYKHFLLFP